MDIYFSYSDLAKQLPNMSCKDIFPCKQWYFKWWSCCILSVRWDLTKQGFYNSKQQIYLKMLLLWWIKATWSKAILLCFASKRVQKQMQKSHCCVCSPLVYKICLHSHSQYFGLTTSLTNESFKLCCICNSRQKLSLWTGN